MQEILGGAEDPWRIISQGLKRQLTLPGFLTVGSVSEGVKLKGSVKGFWSIYFRRCRASLKNQSGVKEAVDSLAVFQCMSNFILNG